MPSIVRLSIAGVLSVFIISCGKQEKEDSPFSRPVTEPIFSTNPTLENGLRRTSYCFPDEQGVYNENIIADSGHDEGGNYNWSQGGACVKRSIRETWAVLHNQELLAWNGVTSSSHIVHEATPETTHFYEVTYVKENGFPLPTVDWTMEWYHHVAIPKNDIKNPERIIINYKKTKGTKFIRYWEGSIIVDFISPSITAIAIRNQMEGERMDEEKAQGSTVQIVDKARSGAANWDAIAY